MRSKSSRIRSRSIECPRFNCNESPLAWLARRRDKTGQPLISPLQLLAGEKLRSDFTFAHMAPRVTTNYSDAPVSAVSRRAAPGAGVDQADGVVAATERVRRALAAVGPELSGVLIDVCCHLKGLEEAERQAAWPQRAGKVVLQLALTRLARHYRLDGSRDSRSIGHWGADDYRPPMPDTM
jgi:hypothetical protein